MAQKTLTGDAGYSHITGSPAPGLGLSSRPPLRLALRPPTPTPIPNSTPTAKRPVNQEFTVAGWAVTEEEPMLAADGALGEAVVTGGLAGDEARVALARRIDVLARFVYPALFAAIVFIAFT